MITKHSYVGDTFREFWNSFKPAEQKPVAAETQLVKIASGCISCPYAGRTSAALCNSCRFASGILYQGDEVFVKCAYKQDSKMIKDASSVQGMHWENLALSTQEHFDKVKKDIKSHILDELKFAAHNIGVKLAQDHYDEFASIAIKEKLSGRRLEKAARSFVTRIEERTAPTHRRHAGKLDDIFSAVTKNSKQVMPLMSPPDCGDNVNVGCGYLGSKKNPNTIWNPDAIKVAAQTPSSDEITRERKAQQEISREKIKNAYWEALQEKLSSKDLISSSRVHSVSTEASAAFNPKRAANTLGIFGENSEFNNIPEKTTGEQIADLSQERATKKAKENEEVQIKAAQTAESQNWLFR